MKYKVIGNMFIEWNSSRSISFLQKYSVPDLETSEGEGGHLFVTNCYRLPPPLGSATDMRLEVFSTFSFISDIKFHLIDNKPFSHSPFLLQLNVWAEYLFEPLM